jgi:hypothetical protein
LEDKRVDELLGQGIYKASGMRDSTKQRDMIISSAGASRRAGRLAAACKAPRWRSRSPRMESAIDRLTPFWGAQRRYEDLQRARVDLSPIVRSPSMLTDVIDRLHLTTTDLLRSTCG